MQLKLVGEAVVDLDEAPTFAAFWLLYPRKVARFDSEKAWKRLGEADQLAAIVGLVAWRQVWMRRGEMQFVPHAATWLNGHRWEDELPEQWVPTSTHSSHVPFTAEQEQPRTQIPDHVRQLLATLRKGKK